MALGGFNGSDPSPTLARFQRYVTERKIHYDIPSAFDTTPPAAEAGNGGPVLVLNGPGFGDAGPAARINT